MESLTETRKQPTHGGMPEEPACLGTFPGSPLGLAPCLINQETKQTKNGKCHQNTIWEATEAHTSD